MAYLSFRQFVEAEEGKASNAPHFDALSDEFGIEPRHFKDFPQISSFFSLGGDLYNLSDYEIIDFKYGRDGKPTHAVVRITNNNPLRRRYKNDQENDKVQIPNEPDDKTYVVPIQDLQDLMTQGMAAAANPQGMGGGMM